MLIKRKLFSSKSQKALRRKYDASVGAKMGNDSTRIAGLKINTDLVMKSLYNDKIKEMSREKMMEAGKINNGRHLNKQMSPSVLDVDRSGARYNVNNAINLRAEAIKDGRVPNNDTGLTLARRRITEKKILKEQAEKRARELAEEKLREQQAIKQAAVEKSIAKHQAKANELRAIKTKKIKNTKIAAGVVGGSALVGAGVYGYKKYKDSKK